MTAAFVLHVALAEGRSGASGAGRGPIGDAGAPPERSVEAQLEEAVGLAAALGVDIVGSDSIGLNAPKAATLLGGGAVEQYSERFTALDVELVVVDAQLSPVQQRNLERAWKVKVLDRTGLILEIFGARAQTREGALQVDLAHLEYQKSRLVRSWTHLERQRGGVGFMGGPGETQIESDRRVLSEKIARLRKKLEKVRRTRALHRAARAKAPAPVVALVGYTNAGKSTLFNKLTESGVLAKDMLFATLDPTMRLITLPTGRKVVLSDTVGFISDLPTQLVAAFRATLEEVLAADVVIHVRDVADPATDAQRADVLTVLRELGFDDAGLEGLIEARNKIDLLEPFERDAALNEAARNPQAVCLSAYDGTGLDDLLQIVEKRLSQAASEMELILAPESGAALAWLYERGCVLERSDDAEGSRLRVKMDALELGRFEKRFGKPMSVSALAAE